MVYGVWSRYVATTQFMCVKQEHSDLSISISVKNIKIPEKIDTRRFFLNFTRFFKFLNFFNF